MIWRKVLEITVLRKKFYSNETHTLKMIAEHEGINQKELSEKCIVQKVLLLS